MMLTRMGSLGADTPVYDSNYYIGTNCPIAIGILQQMLKGGTVDMGDGTHVVATPEVVDNYIAKIHDGEAFINRVLASENKQPLAHPCGTVVDDLEKTWTANKDHAALLASIRAQAGSTVPNPPPPQDKKTEPPPQDNKTTPPANTSLLGSMDNTTLLLLAGGAVVLFMVMGKK